MTAAERRLAKYSRYNASAKGRDRVERYRCTAKGIFARLRADLNQRMSENAARCEALGIDTSRPFAEQIAQLQEQTLADLAEFRRLSAGL